MVLVLLVVMVMVVSEMLSGSKIQCLATENQLDEHLSFYGEEVALLKTEEILFQDIEPPPMKPQGERLMTPEQIKIEENSRGTDSFHDHWATMGEVEKNGESWLLTQVSDEERRFNLNTLVDQRTGNLMPKQKQFLEALLKVLKVKEAEIPGFMDELKDQLDPDDTGKYETKNRNGPFKLLSQLLSLEHVEDEELYYGKNFPEGEIRLLEEEALIDFEEAQAETSEDLEDAPKPPADFGPKKNIQAYEDWDEDEIFPGLKDVLTVYGEGKININTAPMPILMALFKGDQDVALELVRARKKAPLKSLEDVKLVPGANDGISIYADMITFQSNYFRVTLTIQERRVRKRRVSMMMREGSQAITLFRGAIL
jgi:type II secretory pathway component PulK